MSKIRVAVVFGTKVGVGGLGQQVATSIADIATFGSVVACGPAPDYDKIDSKLQSMDLAWLAYKHRKQSPIRQYLISRLRPGLAVYEHDRTIAIWAKSQLMTLPIDCLFAFSQVGLEAIQWAKTNQRFVMLDSPNGHIENFRDVYKSEFERWSKGKYYGHPTVAMVDRVLREYELSDKIRVSSQFSLRTLANKGVPINKIVHHPQLINISKFHLPQNRLLPSGPLRVLFVGTLDLRKGFIYLLQAAKLFGPHRIHIDFVGATGDRVSRRLFQIESKGLSITLQPGDPIPFYHRAELLVMPSLEDGFGFVAGEALACGVPVAITDQCGAAEWIIQDETGWIFPSRDPHAIVSVFDYALTNRNNLYGMGIKGRQSVELRNMLHYQDILRFQSAFPPGYHPDKDDHKSHQSPEP